MSFSLKVKFLLATLITKIWVKIFGLQVNCLLTRLPIVWINPDFTDCLNLCLLREHGYHVTVKEAPSSDPSMSDADPINHIMYKPANNHIIHKPTKEFRVLLRDVISLAEKDLLEF